jgi:hypothetical protein
MYQLKDNSNFTTNDVKENCENNDKHKEINQFEDSNMYKLADFIFLYVNYFLYYK